MFVLLIVTASFYKMNILGYNESEFGLSFSLIHFRMLLPLWIFCTSADRLLFVPLSRHLPSSSPPHQPTFCCSSHSPDTCPHPVLHISRPSADRPTLQTLAPIQSSTSADLLLFVLLSRHLPPSSHPHQATFCCSSHSPDTCPHPVLHIS